VDNIETNADHATWCTGLRTKANNNITQKALMISNTTLQSKTTINNITQKALMISNTTLQNKTTINPGDRECKQFMFHKMTPVVVLIVRSGKYLIGDRGQKTSTDSVQKQDRNGSNTFLPVIALL